MLVHFMIVLSVISGAVSAASAEGTLRDYKVPVERMRDFIVTSPAALVEDGWNRSVMSPGNSENSFTLEFSRGYKCLLSLKSQGESHTAVNILCDNLIGAPDPSLAARNMEKNYQSVLASTIAKARLSQSAEKPASRPAAPAHSDIDTPAYKLSERENDFAVVIGISKYSDLPEAQFAERDAEAVKNHLLALGFPSRNVVLLTGEKAGYKSMEKFIETWLPRHADKNSRVFFYFSGHGAPDVASGKAYLVPWDGDANYIENTGYPLHRLYQKLNALKAKDVIVVMDACFSGAGGRSVIAKGARPLITKVDTKLANNSKVVVFAAASADEITGTEESQGHGLFTYYFLKAINEAKGEATITNIYGYLQPRVNDAARRQGRDQTPQLLPAELGARKNLRL